MTLRTLRITLFNFLTAALLLCFGSYLPAQEQGTALSEGVFSAPRLDSLRETGSYRYGQEPIIEEWQPGWFSAFLSSLSPYVRWVVYGLLFLLAAGLLYLIVRRLIVAPAKKITALASEPDDLAEETLSADELRLRWESAVKAGEYRLAVRYLFLNTLKLMDLAGWVRWEPGKTNLDYASEIHRPDFRDTFRWLTWQFEYAWYGNMQVSEATYQQLEATFLQFQQSMKTRS